MGYDEQDVKVASTMFQKKLALCHSWSQNFNSEELFLVCRPILHEYMNGQCVVIKRLSLPSLTTIYQN